MSSATKFALILLIGAAAAAIAHTQSLAELRESIVTLGQ